MEKPTNRNHRYSVQLLVRNLKKQSGLGEEEEDNGERERQLWLNKWLFKLKKWFLVVHLSYILMMSLLGCVLILIAEGSSGNEISFVDALFTAISCVTCTGLASYDVGTMTSFSTWVRHLLMISGGYCFTSAIGPIMRYVTLSRLKKEVEPQDSDSNRLRRWKLKKETYVHRLMTTSSICIVTTYVIWVTFQLFGFVVLKIFSGMSSHFLVLRAIAAFQGCAFTSLEAESGYISFLIIFAFLSAAGGPLFPVFLRVGLHAGRSALRIWRWRKSRKKLSRPMSRASLLGDEVSMNRDRTSTGQSYHSFIDSFTPQLLEEEWKEESRLISGYDAIIHSSNPVTHHHFLFIARDTKYLAVAWALIALFQFFPYTFQQWSADGVLAKFEWYHKILLGLSQSILTRYAGINFLDITLLSPAHILTIIFAMYIPPVPIPSDRNRRKWKEVVRGSFGRLFSSRFWWLFVCVLVICFFEEDRLEDRMDNTRFGVVTRALFEVISAYATSGLSLSLAKDPFSFSGACSSVSKLIIMMVMLAGRHRGMDLGIDIGLTELQTKDQQVTELERDRRDEVADSPGFLSNDGEPMLFSDDEDGPPMERSHTGHPVGDAIPPEAGIRVALEDQLAGAADGQHREDPASGDSDSRPPSPDALQTQLTEQLIGC